MIKQDNKTVWLIDNLISNGVINLTCNDVDLLAAKKIIEKKWTHVTKLILGGCNIDDQVWKILTHGDYSKLNALSLWNNRITSLGIKQLGKTNWNSINYLTLSHNHIGNKGCKYLSQLNISKVKNLRISSAQIADEGVLHLIKSNWNNIQNVDLSSNMISSIGVNKLVKGILQKLKVLNLKMNRQNIEGSRSLLLAEILNFESLFYSFKNKKDEDMLIKQKYPNITCQ